MDQKMMGSSTKQASTNISDNSDSHLMSRMVLNDNKAGMEGLDKEKINKIIYEASKGSKFYENEKKKEEQLNVRIKEQQAQLNKITRLKLQEGIKEADRILENLEQCYDLDHTIVHVDMDAFYAAVEMRDNPSLRNKPMAVGGMGMLSTSNYIARRYGVRAAMPGFIGLKLCPDLVLVEPNFTKYTAVSHQIREVFAAYDPNFCPMSLDEAYLDFTTHLNWRKNSPVVNRMFIMRKAAVSDMSRCKSDKVNPCVCDLNSVILPSLVSSPELQTYDLTDVETYKVIEEQCQGADFLKVCPNCQKPFPPFDVKLYGVGTEDAVLEMRNRIEQRTLLTASAGIAPNTMLAKICSDKNKPNGQFRIHANREEITKFVENLPIRKISGIGKVTEKLLGALDITVCSDLFQQRGALYHLFSPTSFHYFMRISLGLGSTSVERDGERKSMSTERTFSELSQPDELYDKCKELSISLAEDMQEEHLVGKTVTLKIKTVTFDLKTRSHTLQYDTNQQSKIFEVAKQLLKTEIEAEAPKPLRLRLMGVRMSKLSSDSGHQTLTSMFQKQRNQVNKNSSIDTSIKDNKEDTSNVKLHEFADTEGSDVDQQSSIFNIDDYDDDDDSMAFPWDADRGTFGKTAQKDEASKSLPSNSVSDTSTSLIKTVTKKTVKIKTQFSESILKFLCKGEEKYNKPVTNPVLSDCPDSDIVVLDLDNNNQLSDKHKSFDTTEDTHWLTCPVCGHQQKDWLLDLFNCHVDLCLSKQNSLPEDKVKTDSKPDGIISENVSSQFVADLRNEDSGYVRCPICNQQKKDWSLDLFNAHVDLCLSKQTIKDILQDQLSHSGGASSSTCKSSVSNRKRSNQDNQTLPQSKVQKRSTDQSSLLSFFK